MEHKFTKRAFLAGSVATLFAPTVLHAAQKVKLVTTFTILADMAQNVAGDMADVVSITRPGAEIHQYDPTPTDLRRALGADVTLWNGLNLEQWFARFLNNLGNIPAVTLSDGVVPMPIESGAYTGRPNPHGWMSLENAEIYIDNILRALSLVDAKNASAYAQNAAKYKGQLRATVGPIRDALRALPENRRWLATSEGAFPYLARDCHLQTLSLWPSNSDGRATPQRVRAMIDAMRANNVPAVFSESTVSDKPAKQIAAETGARYGGVLYVDSLSAADGPVPNFQALLTTTMGRILDGLRG